MEGFLKWQFESGKWQVKGKLRFQTLKRYNADRRSQNFPFSVCNLQQKRG